MQLDELYSRPIAQLPQIPLRGPLRDVCGRFGTLTHIGVALQSLALWAGLASFGVQTLTWSCPVEIRKERPGCTS